METLTHHGRETAYLLSDRGGDGPTVLFVHGSGGNHAVWKSQTRLGREYPVVAVDLSGHGESGDVDADPGFETLSAYADDVLAVADETDADVLVGNSLGGAVCMHIALERAERDRFDGLVLAGTGAKLGVLEDLLDWLHDDFERAVEFLHRPDHLFHDPDEKLRDLSVEAMLDTGRAVTERDFLTSNVFDVRDRLADIAVPTLAVVGENDRLTPPRYHEYLRDNVPDCRLAVIDDAAHLAMLERPAAFNDALREFLEDRS